MDEALAIAAFARTAPDSTESRSRIRAAYEQIRRLQTERAELTRSVTTSGKSVSIDEVRGLLGKDEALLAYFLGRSASFAFLVPSRGGTVLCFPLTDEDGRSLTLDAVAKTSQDWIQSISRGAGDPSRGMPSSVARPPREASLRTRGNRMFSSLVPPPLWKELQKRTLVHLLPHGPLNWIPFEALQVGSQEGSGEPVYWIDVGPAIAYQESGSALVWAEQRRKAQIAAPNPGPVLLVADPVYGSAADSVSPHRSVGGPVVVRVQRGGPAARSGVRVGDVISSISGSRVATVPDVDKLLRASPAKASTDLVVRRSDAEHSIRMGPGDPGIEIAPSLPPHLSESIGRTRAQPLERLPGTAREAEAVRVAIEGLGADNGRVARSVVLLQGEEATESLLSAWAPEAAILHIAAHQIPDPAGCSDSGRLALTGPLIPTAEDDGFLDLDDLLLHWQGRLEHCELAVLSSCWSRTGRLEWEEGFFGLPLGLRFAGCPSIVASLWPVDDEVTASLMTEFYKNLEKPGDSGRLRAFLDARRSVKREYPDPYYWSAFVWSGAPR
jgi:hypothetical protein